MITDNKIFLVTKEKTPVRGYWKDARGKLYKDYISLYKALDSADFERTITLEFCKGEKAVFVSGIEKAFVLYPEAMKQETLNVKHSFMVEKGKFSLSDYKIFIKGLLRDFGGFTVLKDQGYNVFLTWSK